MTRSVEIPDGCGVSRAWRVADGHDQQVTGFALGALEQLAAGEVKGASVEAELWANRQLDSMVGMGWIEIEKGDGP